MGKLRKVIALIALFCDCRIVFCAVRRIEKELQRESDIQRTLQSERARARRVDYLEESDDEKEPWERKPYKNR